MSKNLTLKIAPELAFRLLDLPEQLRPSVLEFYAHYINPSIELSKPPLDVRFTKKSPLIRDDCKEILMQGPVRVQQSDTRIIFDLPGLECWWNFASGDAGIAVSELFPESIFYLTRMVLVSLFFHLAQSRGWIGLHAAAVVISDKAIVLTGPSCVGKTTLFQNAYRAGLAILSDDLLWLRQENGMYRAVAFPRGTERDIPGPTHDDVAVAALVLPKIVDHNTSRFFPLPTREVTGELACQAALLGTGEWAGIRFKELLWMIKSLPCFRLTTGSDRSAVPKLLTDLANNC